MSIVTIGVLFQPRETFFQYDWKQPLLYFDKIVMNWQYDRVDFDPSCPEKYIEFLTTLFDGSHPHSKYNSEIHKLSETKSVGLVHDEFKGFDFKKWDKIESEFKELKKQVKNAKESHHLPELIVRHFCILLNNSKENTNRNYVPIINGDSFYKSKIKSQSDFRKQQIINLVINNFPTIHPETDINNIVEFRQNEENHHRFLELRNWITDITQTEFKLNEIQEKIQHLISKYEWYMKYHKIKFERGTLKTSIVGTLEALENTAKLNLSKTVEKAFSLAEVNADLMIAELNAPGRELSYMIKANRTFNPGMH